MITQQHQYSLTEMENMIPWEREAYLTLLTNQIREERERAQQQNG